MFLAQMRKQTTPVTRKDPERHVLCPSDCFSHAYWCCPRVCPGPFCFSLSGVMPLWFHQFFSGQGTGLIDLTPSKILLLNKKRNVFGLEHTIWKFHQLGNLSRVIYMAYVFFMLFEVCIAYIVWSCFLPFKHIHFSFFRICYCFN